MGKETDLLHAVKTGDVSYVRKALQKYRSSHKHKKSSKKTNINIPDNDGFTILHHAALSGNVEVIMALIEMEADPNARDKKGMCPLHMAAWAGKDQGVKCLLESNALVNLPSFSGETAIHLGSQHGYASVVDFLLKFKADPTIRNSSLETPLDLACQYGHTAVVRLLLKNDKVLTMLRGRHDDPRYKSPLHLAAKSGHVEIVRLLIENGADVNEETIQGTCLHHASLYGKTEVVRLLLEAGADVNSLNKNNMTPLDIVNKFTTSRAGIEIKQMLREAAGERIVYARALSNYHNIYDNTCLSFKAGDTITVLEQNEDGRWKGSLMTNSEEKIGYFPAQIVTLISERRSTVSRSSAGSLDSGLSNSSDKENRIPKQNGKKGAQGHAAPKAVGVVPIGSYEVLTLATGGSTAQKQKPANIPRMSSFKRTAAPAIQQRARNNEEVSDYDQRRNTEGSNLERPDMRENRAMTYDMIPIKSRLSVPDNTPQSQNAAQLALAVQQAVESRQEREEGYAVTSPDSSLRNYADVVVGPGQTTQSHLQAPTEYTQVYVGNDLRRTTASSQSSHSDSSNSPRHSYHRQSSNDSKREDESHEQCEYINVDQPPPVPAKYAARTPTEKKKLKTAMRLGYVDMNPQHAENGAEESVPALPKKLGQTSDNSGSEDHLSLKRIESRGIRNRQESYENFSPRIMPLTTHNPFSGAFSNATTNINSKPFHSPAHQGNNNNQDFLPPYENYQPGVVVPPAPSKPGRHPYENLRATNESNREESEPVPLPPKSQQRQRNQQNEQKQLSPSPGSADSMTGVNPLIDYAALSESDRKVFDWLTAQRLSCYFENFQREGFDIIGVCGLIPEDLTALGITKAGHRKKLLSEVTKLDAPNGLPSYKPDDVRTWLSLMAMDNYEENFIEGGFDDIDFIKDLDRNDLEMIEIRKRGHQRKLLMAVQKLAQLELTASLDKIVEGPYESSNHSSPVKEVDEHSFEFPPPPGMPSPLPSPLPPPPPIDEFDDINPLSQREHLPPPPGAESEWHSQSSDCLASPKDTTTAASAIVTIPSVPTPPRSPTSPGIYAIRNGEREPPPISTKPVVSLKPVNKPSSIQQANSAIPVKPPRSPSLPSRSGTLPPPKTKPKPVSIRGQVQTAAEYHGSTKTNHSKGMVFVGPSINDDTQDQDVTPSRSREFWKQASSNPEVENLGVHQRVHRAASASSVKPIPPAKPPIVMPKPKRRNTDSELKHRYHYPSEESPRFPMNGSHQPGVALSSEYMAEETEIKGNSKRVPPPAPPRKESMLTETNDGEDDVFSGPAVKDRTRTPSGPLDEKIKAVFKKSTSSVSDDQILATSLPTTIECPKAEVEVADDDQFKETDILMADIDNLIADFSTQLESMF